MHLASYVGILVVRQRFEGLEGNIGAAGRDPGELRRGHDTDSRILVLERLHQRRNPASEFGLNPKVAVNRKAASLLFAAEEASNPFDLRISSNDSSAPVESHQSGVPAH